MHIYSHSDIFDVKYCFIFLGWPLFTKTAYMHKYSYYDISYLKYCFMGFGVAFIYQDSVCA